MSRFTTPLFKISCEISCIWGSSAVEIPNRRSFLSCKSLRRNSFQEFRRAGSREPLTTRKSAPRPGKPQSSLRTRAKPALYAHPAPAPKGMPAKHSCPGIYSAAIVVAAFLRLRPGSHTIPPQRKKQSASQSTNAIIAASTNKIATVHPPIGQRKWTP